MLKRFLIIVIALMVLCVSGFVWALNSPFVTDWIVSNFVFKKSKAYALNDFSIGAQKFYYPDRVVFKDVLLNIKTRNDLYRIAIKEIQCEGLSRLLKMDTDLQIDVSGVALGSSRIRADADSIKGVVYFRGWGLDRFEGIGVLPQIDAYKYRLTKSVAVFTGDAQHIKIRRLQTNAYGGKIFSQILLDWGKDVPYSVRAQLRGVDVGAMKIVNPSFYGQVEGVINGSVSIQGNARTFSSIKMKANVIKDGRVNASLLKFVTPYIPRTQETVRLDELIKKDLKVPVEVAIMEIRSVDEHKISGSLKVMIGQLNLDLNLPVDILYDGNLYQLIEWSRKLGK